MLMSSIECVIYEDGLRICASSTGVTRWKIYQTCVLIEVRSVEQAPLCNCITIKVDLAHVAELNTVTLQDAFGMLTEMGKEGVMPTVDTFNTLMDACIRRVNPAAVPRLFKQMEQSGTRPVCTCCNSSRLLPFRDRSSAIFSYSSVCVYECKRLGIMHHCCQATTGKTVKYHAQHASDVFS